MALRSAPELTRLTRFNKFSPHRVHASSALMNIGTRGRLDGAGRYPTSGLATGARIARTQEIGKTSAAHALAMQPDWFAGSMPDIYSKDAPIQLCGRWIIKTATAGAVRRANASGAGPDPSARETRSTRSSD